MVSLLLHGFWAVITSYEYTKYVPRQLENNLEQLIHLSVTDTLVICFGDMRLPKLSGVNSKDKVLLDAPCSRTKVRAEIEKVMDDDGDTIETYLTEKKTQITQLKIDDNGIIRTRVEKLLEPKLKNRIDLVELLGIANTKKGTNVAGGRGFYLKGDGVLLNQAFINFGLAFLSRSEYTPLHTPFFMRKEIMATCSQLAQFGEELYKLFYY